MGITNRRNAYLKRQKNEFDLESMKLDISLRCLRQRQFISILGSEHFLCLQGCYYLQRYKAIKSLLDTHTYVQYLSLARREAIAFFIYFYFIQFMPKTNEIRGKKNNSNLSNAANSRKTVPYREFETEMNAKNQAYLFILTHNLLNEFAEFCKNYHPDDPHSNCLRYLSEQKNDKPQCK